MTRLIYKNTNSINNRLANNKKVEKAKESTDNLEADLVAYNEHRMNLKHIRLFQGGEADIQTVSGQNAHENGQLYCSWITIS